MKPKKRISIVRPYVDALSTDIRKTFKRIERQIKEKKEAEEKARMNPPKRIRSVA